jgi:predicted dehydrogenase
LNEPDRSARAIRWGILGTGAIARAFALDLRLVPGAKVCAIGSRRLDRARQFAGEFGAGRAFDTVAGLAGDEEVDVVYVATPHPRHHDDCLACLAAGSAVLCEKPFTLNAVQAGAVIDQARASGRFCMEAMWMRFHPLIQQVQSLVRSGAIGEVRLLLADFGYPAAFSPDNRFYDLQAGGGALLDRGVYLLSLAYFLLGVPADVTGRASIGATGVDEQHSALLTYKGGVLAVLTASLRSRLRNEALIVGTRGQIRIHDPFFAPRRVSVSHFEEPVGARTRGQSSTGWKARVKQNALLRRAYDTLGVPLLPLVHRGANSLVHYGPGEGYQFEAAEVVRCLRAGMLESPIMPLDETRSVLETTDALRRSWGLAYPGDGH